MNSDNDLYENYVQGHLQGRKGVPSSENDLVKSSQSFNAHFKKHLPIDKDARILDVGCGYGIMVWWLHSNGYKNTRGIDLSAQQIELGHSLGITSIAVAEAYEYIQSTDEKYDMIVLRDVIEHFDREQVLEFFAICRRVLKKNGKLLIQTVNGSSPLHGEILFGDFTHKWAYTDSSLRQLIIQAGYKGVEFYSWRPTGNGIRTLRLIAWAFVEALLRCASYAQGGRFYKILTINLIAVVEK